MKQRLETFFFFNLFWSPTEVVRTLACSFYSLKRINKPPCPLCVPCQRTASALVNWDDHQPSAGQFASGHKEPNTCKFLQLLLQLLVKQERIYTNACLLAWLRTKWISSVHKSICICCYCLPAQKGIGYSKWTDYFIWQITVLKVKTLKCSILHKFLIHPNLWVQK